MEMTSAMQRRAVPRSTNASAPQNRLVIAPAMHLSSDRNVVREANQAPKYTAGRSASLAPHKAACQRATRLAPVAAVHAAAPAAAAAAAAGIDRALNVTCKVVVPYHPTSHGQQLVLVGSCEALGNWDVKKGVNFTWCEGHSHVAELELPIHSSIACKLVVLGANDSAAWEPETDRELLLAPSSLAGRAAGYTVLCHWGFPDCTQVLANSTRRTGAGLVSGKPTNGRHPAAPSTNDNPIIAGVKKALAHATSKDRFAVIPGIAAWDDEQSVQEEQEEEEPALVQCQVTVLIPKSGPKLKPEQSLVLVGGSAALGQWDPANGLPLERSGEESPMWTAQAELPLGGDLQAKVVVVDTVSGEAQVWEQGENRSLERRNGGAKPVMVTAYWGEPATHCLEVDRLSSAASASNPQVVQLLRQQLAATSTQLDGLRRERDDARKAMSDSQEHLRHLEVEVKSLDKSHGRFEMVQLAEQLQTTRRLYETTKKEARELGGSVGVTRQLCEAAKRELSGLSKQLDAAKRAYEALAPEVERMELKLASTSRAFDATKPELVALEAQLERARTLFDRTLQKIEAAKSLSASGEFDAAVRRRSETRVREVQYAKM